MDTFTVFLVAYTGTLDSGRAWGLSQISTKGDPGLLGSPNYFLKIAPKGPSKCTKNAQNSPPPKDFLYLHQALALNKVQTYAATLAQRQELGNPLGTQRCLPSYPPPPPKTPYLGGEESKEKNTFWKGLGSPTSYG